MDSFAFAEINNFNAVVAQGADEEPFAGGIKSEMVYSTLDTRQRDCLLRAKRLRVCRRRATTTK